MSCRPFHMLFASCCALLLAVATLPAQADIPDETFTALGLTRDATPKQLYDALVERYGAVADRLVLYFANPGLADADTMERFGEVARQVVQATAG